MNINLSKPQYNLSLTPAQISVIHAALLELPAKVSMTTIEAVVGQVMLQERAPSIAPVESATG